MMLHRRDFVAGVAVTTVAPTLALVPASPPILATELSPLVIMIEGWSVPDESNVATAVWIRVGRSWRTAWR